MLWNMILIPQGKLSSLRAMRPFRGGAWAGGKKVEIAFLWGYAVDSTASLCNNGVYPNSRSKFDPPPVKLS